MNITVCLLLLALSLSCCSGQSMESIPSSSVVKKPGETLSVSCRGSGFTFTCCTMHWIRQPAGKALEWMGVGFSDASRNTYASSVRGRAQISRDDGNSMVYLKLSNLKPEDSAVYYCAKGGYYGFDYWGKGTMVTVTSATPVAPTVLPLRQCGSDTEDMVTLGCLATGFTPSSLTYKWSKDGTALTDFIQYPPVLKNNVYSAVSQIQVKREEWDAKKPFQCSVTHSAGNANAFVQPPSPPPPTILPTLRVLANSDEETEASFICFAKDFSPKDYEIEWLRNDEKISKKITEVKVETKSREENGTTLYHATGLLTVPSSEWTDGTTFTCLFTAGGKTTNSSVTYKGHDCCPEASEGCPEADVEVKIIPPKMEDMLSNRKGFIICEVNIKKPPVDQILWEDENGNKLAPNKLSPGKGKTGIVTLPLEISFDEWSQGAKRYCVVEHNNWFERLRKPYERIIGGQPQRPSVFMLPPLEHTKKQTVTLTCYVKDFFPQDVYVSWLVDDEKADSTYKFHTTNPVENQGSYSAYGQLSLSLEQWKNSGTVYSCVVYHESVVNTTKAIVRSIGNRSFEKTNLVNLNMNIPETCKAQ